MQRLFKGERGGGTNPTRGRVGDEEITERDLEEALLDMDRLAQYVGMGRDPVFRTIRRNGTNARLAYWLLLHEARSIVIIIPQAAIYRFLAYVGLVEE